MPDMDGKVVLVTGATRGIGRQAALTLADVGAVLVVVGRDEARTASLLREVQRRSPGSRSIVADLATIAEVRRTAATFLEHFDRLDVLINNVGATFTERTLTADGLERTFALNHLGYFVLTAELRDVLHASAPARIVNVSSAAHRNGSMHWDDLQLEAWPGNGWPAYCQSKLANILFTRQLAEQLSGTGVTANSVHPGFVNTGFGKNNGWLSVAVMTLLRPLQRTAEHGADTVIWAASAPELQDVSGAYLVDRREVVASEEARSADAAQRLWAVSAGLLSS